MFAACIAWFATAYAFLMFMAGAHGPGFELTIVFGVLAFVATVVVILARPVDQ